MVEPLTKKDVALVPSLESVVNSKDGFDMLVKEGENPELIIKVVEVGHVKEVVQALKDKLWASETMAVYTNEAIRNMLDEWFGGLQK